MKEVVLTVRMRVHDNETAETLRSFVTSQLELEGTAIEVLSVQIENPQALEQGPIVPERILKMLMEAAELHPNSNATLRTINALLKDATPMSALALGAVHGVSRKQHRDPSPELLAKAYLCISLSEVEALCKAVERGEVR